jgi:hypothetical protein
MIQTWSSGKGNDVTCKKCGSIYEVSIYRMPNKDKDSFECEVCGSLVREWNDTCVPSFQLKSAGKKPSEPE